jgi:hypothetical protein
MSPDDWHLLRQNYSGTTIIVSSNSGYTGHALSVRGVNAKTIAGSTDPIAINIDGTIAGNLDLSTNAIDGDSSGGPTVSINSDGSARGAYGIAEAKSFSFLSDIGAVSVSGSGTLTAWGNIANSKPPLFIPLTVPNIENSKKVIGSGSSGYQSFYVSTTNNELLKINYNYETGDPEATSISSDCVDFDAAFAAFGGWSLTIKEDKTVCYSGNISHTARMVIPDGLNDIIEVATGSFYSVALRSDGTIIGWRHYKYDTFERELPEFSLPPQLTHADGVSINEDPYNDAIVLFRRRAL